ncbi:MAG: hypothetical protein ACO1PW_07340 [Actinomycetota bacterium]
MGLFKQMKDMKAMVEAAPEMMQAAQAAATQAQQLAALQAQQAQAAAAATGAPTAPAPADVEPIAGVTLEVYAEISRGLAAHGYDTSKSFDLAAARGISRDDWQAAMDGWNARMAASPAVGRAFNDAYMGR